FDAASAKRPASALQGYTLGSLLTQSLARPGDTLMAVFVLEPPAGTRLLPPDKPSRAPLLVQPIDRFELARPPRADLLDDGALRVALPLTADSELATTTPVALRGILQARAVSADGHEQPIDLLVTTSLPVGPIGAAVDATTSPRLAGLGAPAPTP